MYHFLPYQENNLCNYGCRYEYLGGAWDLVFWGVHFHSRNPWQDVKHHYCWIYTGLSSFITSLGSMETTIYARTYLTLSWWFWIAIQHTGTFFTLLRTLALARWKSALVHTANGHWPPTICQMLCGVGACSDGSDTVPVPLEFTLQSRRWVWVKNTTTGWKGWCRGRNEGFK